MQLLTNHTRFAGPHPQRETVRVATCPHAEDRLCWDCYQQALAAEREECARLAETWPGGRELAKLMRSQTGSDDN